MYENGNGLIFATGAPGSRWSKIFTVSYFSPEVNGSERDNCPKYMKRHKTAWAPKRDGEKYSMQSGDGQRYAADRGEESDKEWRMREFAQHSGAYFGPGNMFGHNFHNLPDMTKEEFLEECAKPFTNPWDGRKMFVKSHWFAYNLQWLQENFPEASFAFCYSPMPEAFKWWHLCGGWNITYPDYSWYGTDERMIEGIMAENALIKDFITKNNLKFDHNESFEGFYSELGFEQPEWLRSKYHPEVGLESISPEQFREDIEKIKRGEPTKRPWKRYMQITNNDTEKTNWKPNTRVPIAVYNPSRKRNEEIESDMWEKADQQVRDGLYGADGPFNINQILKDDPDHGEQWLDYAHDLILKFDKDAINTTHMDT